VQTKTSRGRYYIGANQKSLRCNNRGLIYRAIWEMKHISRAALANETGLHPATITHIVNELMDVNLVVEVGSVESASGRPPLQLEINAKAAYVVGVNLTRTTISAALIDLSGNVGEVITFDGLNLLKEQDYTLMRLRRAIALLLESNSMTGYRVIGIGVGVPGPVDPSTGHIYLADAEAAHIPLSLSFATLLSEQFHLPAFVDNNSNTLALSEKYLGEGRHVENFVCINCAFGVGGSLVLNGELYYGPRGGAGEIGHIIVNTEGAPCTCGNRGCLELYASEPALISQVARGISDSSQTLTVNQVAALYNAGHEAVVEVIQRVSTYMGYAVINVVNTLAPELVVLGGSLGQLTPIIADQVQERVRHSLASPLHQHTRVVSSQIENGAVRGAAMLVIRQVQTIGSYDLSSHLAN
jgi:N-acetylglucosamine repressor